MRNRKIGRLLLPAVLAGMFAWASVGASSCGSTTSSGGDGLSGAPAAKKHPNMTTAEANALEAARNYLSLKAFSKRGLIEQLSSSAGDGYSRNAATFAVNHLHVNWYKQAAKSAKDYLKLTAMSKSGLIQQLSSSAGDGFTAAQAEYGANQAYK